jgi:hypothetical protein
MKYPGGRFAYRHPRTLGVTEIIVGMWVVFLGILVLSQGSWWAVPLFVVAALPFWVGRDLLQSTVRS